MQNAITIKALRQVPLFDGLTEEQLWWVVEQGSEKFVPAGEDGGREGEPVDHLNVILEGEFRWSRKVAGGEVVMNTYGPGAFFAEVPLLLGKPYLATWRALIDSRLFLLPNEAFRWMLTTYPSFSKTVLEMLAQRVQVLYSVGLQREQQNSLSTLAAGLAHELNNPATANQRAIGDLHKNIEMTKKLAMKLAQQLSPSQLEALTALEETMSPATVIPSFDPLTRGELEDEMASWLEARGVENGFEFAPTFVGAELDVERLESVETTMPRDVLPDVLSYLGAALTTARLLGEAGVSVGRILATVGAVKSYSNMDRAPLVEVDINEGIDHTLAVLGHKLGPEIEVSREYDPNMPRITAYGGELNQVWTNLIDNAIDAVDGRGHIRLRTTCEGDRVMVEVADDGPGIPEELQPRVFQPFYTTKGASAGTGLGLGISYRIVVGRHGGDIRVVSKPGDTRFEVRLPTDAPINQEARRGVGDS